VSLVMHYRVGDIHDPQGISASEMTYVVSGGALNYSLADFGEQITEKVSCTLGRQ